MEPEPLIGGLFTELDQLIQHVEDFRHEGWGDRKSHSLDDVMAYYDVLHQLAQARQALGRLASEMAIEIQHTRAPMHLCLCHEADNSECPLHRVGHPFQPECCDQPEEAHRHATRAEFEAMCPLLFDQRFDEDGTSYRVDARRYRGGVGVTFTRQFPVRHDEDEDDEIDFGGLCFDFDANVVPPLIRTLQELAAALERD